MKKITVQASIPRPAMYLLRLFAEYTHVERLHAHRNVWVEPLYEKGDVSICLWHIKVLGKVRVSRQLQIVYPEGLSFVNETLDGFGKGSLDIVTLKETKEGTEITDVIQIRLPWYLFWMEPLVARFTRQFSTGFYQDHLADETGEAR